MSIGYFSPEFGITEVLPQYSGGLGILAGDHLKAASDLGVPIIGVGLLYRQGYFRQSLNAAGWQQERYPLLDPNSLPLTLLHDDSGPVRIEVPLAGRTLFAQVWVAQVGRVPLLMLDSDVEQNAGYEREVTDRLYGGGTDHRLEQEVLLGMGAYAPSAPIAGSPAPRRQRCSTPTRGTPGSWAWSGFVSTCRTGDDFDTALERSRARTIFTTHTPVPAGIDRFPRELIVHQFAGFEDLPLDRVLALGAEDYAGRRPEQVQHGCDGFPAGTAGQRGVCAPWLGVPRDVPGAVAIIRHQRGADRRHHQRRAPSHLGTPRAARAARGAERQPIRERWL